MTFFFFSFLVFLLASSPLQSAQSHRGWGPPTKKQKIMQANNQIGSSVFLQQRYQILRTALASYFPSNETFIPLITAYTGPLSWGKAQKRNTDHPHDMCYTGLVRSPKGAFLHWESSQIEDDDNDASTFDERYLRYGWLYKEEEDDEETYPRNIRFFDLAAQPSEIQQPVPALYNCPPLIKRFIYGSKWLVALAHCAAFVSKQEQAPVFHRLTPVGYNTYIQAAALSCNETFLALAIGKKMRLYNTATQKYIKEWGGHQTKDKQQCDVWGLAFHPQKNNILASCGGDHKVRIWDVDHKVSHNCLDRLATLEGHADDVMHVAYSPDGRYLASSSTDKTVRIWDTRKKIAALHTLYHDHPVSDSSFSADSSLLASAAGNRVTLWTVAIGEQRTDFTHDPYPDKEVHRALFDPEGSIAYVVHAPGGSNDDLSYNNEIMLHQLGYNLETVAP